MSDDQQRKIIIDDDWKSQAQAEKQKLADAEAAKKRPQGPGAGAEGDEGPLEPTFEELVKMLATQALMYLGAIPDPGSGRAILAPEYAKLHIDLLGVLEEKTKGNLSPEEDKLLKGMLYELRMQFVEISKALAQAIAEGKIKPGEGGVIGGPGVGPTPGPGMGAGMPPHPPRGG